MPWEPIVPDGQHLGKSHSVDGAVTGHLFDDDTNDLRGHASWRFVEAEEDDDYGYSSRSYQASSNANKTESDVIDDELAEAIAKLIVVGIIYAVALSAPAVKRWWLTKVAPKLKKLWSRIARAVGNMSAHREGPPQSTTLAIAAGPALSSAVDEAKLSMPREEWRARYEAMLAAGAFAEEQRRLLQSVVVRSDRVTDVAVLHMANSEGDLTARQFVDEIAATIRANPSLMEDQAVAEIAKTFMPAELQRQSVNAELPAGEA